MADMITRCPQCATAFRITAAHLKSAKGSVRCGACFTIFNALENLSERHMSSTPANFVADDMLISDNMGLDDDGYDTPADSSSHSSFKTQKQSLFEQDAAQAKRESEKVDADESWALDLLDDDDLDELPHSADEDFIEEEPSFRPFVPAPPQEIELSDDFLKATNSQAGSVSAQPPVSAPSPLQPTPPVPSSPPKAAEPAILAPVEKPKVQQKPQEVPPPLPQVSSVANIATPPAPANGLIQTFPEAMVRASVVQPKPVAPSEIIQTSIPKIHSSALVTELSSAHPELNVEALKELDQALALAKKPTGSSLSKNARLVESLEPEPLEVSWRPKSNRWSRPGVWLAGSLIAGVIAITQLGIIQFDQWRHRQPFEKFYSQACTWLSCPTDKRIDLDKIATSNLLVHSHPTQANALIVDAILINKADFQQQFPGLILSFRNLQNQLLAERVFQPAEYLGGELSGQSHMPVRQSIHIALEIIDPGKDAVSYSLAVLQ